MADEAVNAEDQDSAHTWFGGFAKAAEAARQGFSQPGRALGRTGLYVAARGALGRPQRHGFVAKARTQRGRVARYAADLQRQQRKADLEAIAGTSAQAAMGNQIRDYVMAPYQQVKDKRTGFEVGNIQGVLDGDLDDLMSAFLRHERANQ